MLQKTYMAPFHLEWKLLLKGGEARIPVLFEGGSMGSNGIIGARYVTDNKVFQKLIEDSPEFQAGKIILLASREIKDKKTDCREVNRQVVSSGYQQGSPGLKVPRIL